MDAITVNGLTKHYSKFSIENISFSVPQGCIVGLIGENGAGKSTTIRLILDMIRPDQGSITIFGKDNHEYREKLLDEIGVVLDEVGLPQILNISEIERIMKNSFHNWDTEIFHSYIERFHLPIDKKFKDFSKGMKMKLSLAIALSHHAKLLILDEATSGLDPVVRDEILDIFLDFTRDEGHSVLISSHIVSDLEKLCDYIAFLHQGKLMLFEEKDKLLEEYAMIHCTEEQLNEICESSIIGRKVSPYGAEAIVKRDEIPQGFSTSPIDIEQLFIFMVKE